MVRKHKICAAPNCSYFYHKSRPLSFFRFPKQTERCLKWVQNAQLDKFLMNGQLSKPAEELNKGQSLCAQHFDLSQFVNDELNSLVWNAVPTRFEEFPLPVPTPTPVVPYGRHSATTSDVSISPESNNSLTSSSTPLDASSSTSHEINISLPSSLTPSDASATSLETNISLPASASSIQPPSFPKESETPRKTALRRQVKRNLQKVYRLKRKVKRLDGGDLKPSKKNCIALLGHYLKGPAFSFVASQIRQAGIPGKGRRYTSIDKATALSLYHASPKCYRLLSTMFTLPTRQTLCRSIRKVEVYPGFPSKLLHAFERKVSSMSSDDKKCAIIFDEMSLKQNLTYDKSNDCIEGLEDLGPILGKQRYSGTSALVFMVRGLKTKWKQPIGYFITSSTISASILKQLLLQCIGKVYQVGLDPKVVVCDQGSNNASCMSKHLGVSVEKPYFEIDGKRIMMMWDTPHLIKNTRNNLRNNGFSVDEHTVSWSHIEAFYHQDSKLEVRCAPKLKDKHINLPNFSAMHVRTACQTLSRTVAKGICLFSTLGLLPAEALHTARFCENFDKLFNAFNSSSMKSSRPYNHILKADSSHWKMFDEMTSYIKAIKPRNSISLPCLNGWLSNINCLSLLFHELGFDFLLTNRLNQDCIENLFFQIRSKGGNSDNPDPQNFRAHIRDVMVDQLLVTSDRTNCELDVDQFLLDLNSLSSSSESSSSVVNTSEIESESLASCSASSVLLPIGDHDYTSFSFTVDNVVATDGSEGLKSQKINVLSYISGYILTKLSNVLCDSCTPSCVATPVEATQEPQYEFLRLKSYIQAFSTDEGRGLTFPASFITEAVVVAEDRFQSVFEEYFHLPKLKQKMLLKILPECPPHSTDTCCRVVCRVVSAYISIRIYQSLKLKNNALKRVKYKRSRKLMKLSNL